MGMIDGLKMGQVTAPKSGLRPARDYSFFYWSNTMTEQTNIDDAIITKCVSGIVRDIERQTRNLKQIAHYYDTPIKTDAVLWGAYDLEDAGAWAAKQVTMRDRIDNCGWQDSSGTHSEDYVNGQEPVQDEIVVDVTDTMPKLLEDIEQAGKGFALADPEFVITDTDGVPIYKPRVLVKFAVKDEE